MADTRKANYNWKINTNSNGTTPTEDATLAVLMDIRDELKALNILFHCTNFTEMPHTLKRIERAIPRRKRNAKLRRVA
jgi:hypothetical protein